MVAAVLLPTVMRAQVPQPTPAYSLQQTVAVVLTFLVAPVALVLALSYPVPTAGVVLATAATTVVARTALTVRRRRGTTRTIHLPHTGLAVEV